MAILLPNNTIARNLQEQVLKNQDDIEVLKTTKSISDLGIKIIQPTPLQNVSELPTDYEGEYGDAYLVGLEPPYDLYIWTRSKNPAVSGYWFDWGQLNAPSTVPGPEGPRGPEGPQGTRGSRWNSQSGRPTNTENVLNYDQALDTLTGDVYQYENGVWRPTGTIRGPKGLDGAPGEQGIQGPQGLQGPVGPQGPQGQFISIVAELENTDQLPNPNSVPRYSAYIIKNGNNESHIWVIIGDTNLEWYDAGYFGGATSVTINDRIESNIDLTNVPNSGDNYDVTDTTTTVVRDTKVDFTDLKTSYSNLKGTQKQSTSDISLPLTSSDDITLTASDGKTLKFNISQAFKNSIATNITEGQSIEVQITAPTTATNGQLSEEQLTNLQKTKNAYLLFNNEVYRLQDNEHEAGYLIYTHIGYMDTIKKYTIKCITITLSTRGWVLTSRNVEDPNKLLYNLGTDDTMVDNDNKTSTITRRTGFFTITAEMITTAASSTTNESGAYVYQFDNIDITDAKTTWDATIGTSNIGYEVKSLNFQWVRANTISIEASARKVQIGFSSSLSIAQIQALCPIYVEYELANPYTQTVITGQPLYNFTKDVVDTEEILPTGVHGSEIEIKLASGLYVVSVSAGFWERSVVLNVSRGALGFNGGACVVQSTSPLKLVEVDYGGTKLTCKQINVNTDGTQSVIAGTIRKIVKLFTY